MADRTLTIRGIADAVLARLRARAAANRRSLNGELLAILDRAAAGDQPAPGPTHAPQGTVHEPPAVPYGDATRTPATLMAEIDRDALEEVCRRHHIVWLAIFGSHARGDARPDSDVDVVVDFAPGTTPGFGIVRVAESLRPIFRGRAVDLVTRRGLAPRLREPVLSSAMTLYAAE